MHLKLANRIEEIAVDLPIAEVKSILSHVDDQPFFISSINNEKFVISLKFSLGKTYLFPDVHYDKKSEIYAKGEILADSSNSKVILRFRNKQFLYLILLIPVVILLIAWIDKASYLIFFAIIPILAFFLFKYIFSLEENRLISDLKVFLENKTHYNNSNKA